MNEVTQKRQRAGSEAGTEEQVTGWTVSRGSAVGRCAALRFRPDAGSVGQEGVGLG